MLCIACCELTGCRAAQDGTTPLIEASRKGQVGVVSELLGKGADIEAKDDVSFVMIPQYRPIYTPVHVHLVCGSILFPSSGGNSLVAKLSSGEPGVVGSSPVVSTSPLTL